MTRDVSPSLVALVLASSVLLAATAAAQPSGARGRNVLLQPAAPSWPIVAEDPTVVRARAVAVDLDLLAALAEGDAVRLDLFEDVVLTAVLERSEVQPGGNTAWVGRIEEDPLGTFAWVAGEGVLVGNIHSPAFGEFQIRPDSGGHAVREVDLALSPPCGVGPDQEVRTKWGGGGTSLGLAADDGSVFDVMVLYTPLVRNASRSINSVNALIDLAIVETNQAFDRSGIGSRLRLVFKSQIAYDESGDFGTHLSRLRGKTDGFMDEVHAIRDAVGADMVALLVTDNQFCGIAYLMTTLSPGFEANAFSVTNHTCATGGFTFGHELGHNMGSHHDHDNAGTALFSYSYGHRFFGQGGGQYRTIMAYSPGSRIQNYSNPNVPFDGTPTGIPEGSPDAADNARSINNAALTVANWRMSEQPMSGLLFSTANGHTAGGLSFMDSDVVFLDLASGQISMVIDMSDVIPTHVDVDALHQLGDGSFLLSFRLVESIPGLAGGPNGDLVDPQDIVRFLPTQLGQQTAGSFEFYFDGSDVGLDTGGENIDALSVQAGGALHVSMTGVVDLGGGVTGRDEDLFLFVPSSLGANTSGTWSILFDGSDPDVKLGTDKEDVDGYYYDDVSGDLTVTTTGNFRIPLNRVGQNDDLITFIPLSLGANTQGTWMNLFEGATYGLAGANIDAIHVVR